MTGEDPDRVLAPSLSGFLRRQELEGGDAVPIRPRDSDEPASELELDLGGKHELPIDAPAVAPSPRSADRDPPPCRLPIPEVEAR